MVTGQDDERSVVTPHKFNEHDTGLWVPSFRGGDYDEVSWIDSLAVLAGLCLDTQGKPCIRPCNNQKRGICSDQQEFVIREGDHSSATSSDWQLGHMGFLPMPMNRSPHSLHR